MAKAIEKKFRATLEKLRSSLGWVVIHVPFNVAETWGTRGQMKVCVTVNGTDFRTSLFPTRSGVHFMIVNKKMQKAAGIRAGMPTNFTMRPDVEERVVASSSELARVLKQDRDLRKFFDSLNYSARNDINRWISEPKSADARTRRAEQLAERLMETMEAEIELPPLIRTAFARNPAAYDGWQLMTPTQRRSQLLAIFYYRTPDARARRLQKVIEAAAEHLERHEARQERKRA